MAVMIYNARNYVENGDVFICKLLTDQNITMFYRCKYLDGNNGESDKLLVFNFENHWPKDDIFIPCCGEGCISKDIIIEAIKKKWDCGTEFEFIKNNNLLINISRK